MKHVARIMPALLLCSILCAGCFVKEDRRFCPCRLFLDLSSIDISCVDSVTLVGMCDGVEVISQTIHSESFVNEYEVLVPRTKNMRLQLLSGSSGFRNDGESLIIPFGMDCPPVYMENLVIDTECEITKKKVSLHKNFCRLTVHLVDGQNFPYILSVRGGVDGYLFDGSPSEGRFYSHATEYGNGSFMVVLPRQIDGSLTLDIDDESNVLKSFALGEILNNCGYDWNAPDLEDITVGLDYSRTNMTIMIQNWEKVYEFDFVI